MALVIDLKPKEKVLIGTAVITNDSQRTRLHISGEAPIIREKDIMREEEANTPCKLAYFYIQCMYMARNPKDYYEKYFKTVEEVQHAAPKLSFLFLSINEKLIEGNYYKAMKEAKELIELEQDLIKHATG